MLKKSLYCLGLAACVTLPSWADTSEWGRWSKFRFGGHVRQILATGFYVQTPSGAEVYVRQDQKVLRNGQVINPTFLKPNESVQVIVPPGRGQIRHRDDAVAVLPTADGPTQVPENNLQIAMDQAAMASVAQNPAPSAQYYLAAPAPRQNYASAPIYAPSLNYGGGSSAGGSYGGFYDSYAYDPGPVAYDPGFLAPVPAAPVNYYYQQPYMAPAPFYPAYNNNFTNPNGSFSWENAAVSLVGTALVATLSNQGWNNFNPGFNPGWNQGYAVGWNSYDPGYAQNWSYNPGYAAGWNNFANYAPAYPVTRGNRPWNRPQANHWNWGNQGNVAVYNINQIGSNNWHPRNNGWNRGNYRVKGPGYGNWHPRNNGWQRGNYWVNGPRYGNWNPRNSGWQRGDHRIKGPRNNGWQRANYRVNQQRYNNYRPRNNNWQRANYRVNQQRYNNPRPRNNNWQRANYRVNQQRYNNYRPRNNNWQRANHRVSQPRNNWRPRDNSWQRSNYRVNQPRYNNYRPQNNQPRFRGGGGNHGGGQPRFRGGGGNFGGGQPRFRGGGGNRGGGQPRFRGGGGNFGGGQPRFRGGGGNPGGGGRGRRGR